MKNNKATWIFLIALIIIGALSAVRFKSILNTPLYPLVVFVMALHVAIQFFEWVGSLPSNSKWFKYLPFLQWFITGNNVGFWHRQVIFLSGFGFGYAYLLYESQI